MFAPHTPFMLRRRDGDDDYNAWPPEPKSPSLRRKLSELVLTTLVTASVTKLVEHFYDRWSDKKDDKTEEKTP